MNFYFRWINDKNHGIPLEKWQKLLTLFKDMVYASTEESFEYSYHTVLEHTETSV